jgi:hypothetical protein
LCLYRTFNRSLNTARVHGDYRSCKKSGEEEAKYGARHDDAKKYPPKHTAASAPPRRRSLVLYFLMMKRMSMPAVVRDGNIPD